MSLSDRQKPKFNKYQCFSSLIIATIIPFSAIAFLEIKPLAARETRVENVVIFVDSQTGNDNNQGTKNSPLKTITQALKIAPPNSTVSLAYGTYNEASGETFPLIIRNKITLKGLAGGQGHNVIIEGSGSFISHSAAEQNVTIAAIKNAGGIIGVTVTNPHGRGHGVWIESANPRVESNTFTRNGNTGLSVNGNSKPIIANNYFHRNSGNGLLIYGNSKAQVTDNSFENTGFGVSLVQNSTATLENNIFKGNRIGVILEGNSQGTLRNNQITTSLESGLVTIAKSKADLGVSNRLGNNVFSGNKKFDIQNITDSTISATGTEINGQIAGKIDFSDRAVSAIDSDNASDNAVASNRDLQNPNFSRLRKNPLPENNRQTNQEVAVTQPPPLASNPPVTNEEILPPPPPITATNTANQSNSKKYIFAAPATNEVKKRITTTIPVNNNAVPLFNTARPSSLGDRNNSRNIGSLSDVLATSTPAGIKYRVLVETNNDGEQAKVKSLYPEAFNTVYQGKSMLQIGAFSDRSKAEIASRSLSDLGLISRILE